MEVEPQLRSGRMGSLLFGIDKPPEYALQAAR